MKRILLLTISALLTVVLFSCKEDESVATYDVRVQLNYPDGYHASDSVEVTLTNTLNNSVFKAFTDSTGQAEYKIPEGAYSVSASEKRSVGGVGYNFNGLNDFTVSGNWNAQTPVNVNLVVSKTSQLVIKELYIGGCQKDDGSGSFSMDKYVVLYNNSDFDASLSNLCLAMVLPYNGNATNKDYVDGKLLYEAEGWIPAGQGIWYFPDNQNTTLKSGEQLVVALNNAVNNTATYSKSINFAKSEYYCTYDISVYPNTTYYPSPSVEIPASHYLKAINYGTGNAWSISAISPAFFIFTPQGITPAEFAADAARTSLYGGSSTQVRKKVPVEWVLDGIEVYKQGTTNYKRLTAGVDAGFINHINTQGYTLYRNVDKAATEAIASNAGKLVYNYSGGTTDVADGTTDGSAIDAEASQKNGARIIYADTNNSSVDFHQRKTASLH